MNFKIWKVGDEAFTFGYGWVILKEGGTQTYPLEFEGVYVREP